MSLSGRKLLEYGLIACILALAILLASNCAGFQQDNGLRDVRKLSEGWYRLEDGRKIPVAPGRELALEGAGDLTIYNDSLTAADAGKTFALWGAVCRPVICAGDAQIYAYDDSAFPRNEQMRAKLYCTCRLPADYAGQTLSVRYENPGNGKFDLSRAYVGAGQAVFIRQCAANAFTLLLVFAMLLLAVLALIAHFNLRAIHAPDPRFIDAAVFLILCAAWCLLDSSLAQELSGQSAAVCHLSFYAFMTFAIPMLHFVRNIGDMKRFRSLKWCMGLFYLNAIAQGILGLSGAFELIEMLWVTHALLFGGVALCSALLLRQYRQTRNRGLRHILWAFLLMAASGVIAICMYWLLGISYYESIFECGLLVFIIILLRVVLSATADNLRFRIEAGVYQRLSRQDGLTGMANRRGFDDFLSELEKNADSYDDVAMVFMDLNGLKETNDEYGHGAGDELIISAARCIEGVFGAENSYRIGGDEFSAILVNPREQVEQELSRLDQAVWEHNVDGRHRLSIARGYSLLRDESGQVKRLSDWKYEADRSMYMDKQRRKQAAQRSNLSEGGA